MIRNDLAAGAAMHRQANFGLMHLGAKRHKQAASRWNRRLYSPPDSNHLLIVPFLCRYKMQHDERQLYLAAEPHCDSHHCY